MVLWECPVYNYIRNLVHLHVLDIGVRIAWDRYELKP